MRTAPNLTISSLNWNGAEATTDPRNRVTQWLDQKESSMFCSKGNELTIRLYGLDGSGKTRILYKLALGEDVETILT